MFSPPRVSRVITIVVALIVGVTNLACSSSASDAPSSNPPATESAPKTTIEPPSPRPHDFTSFRNDGPMTKERALQVFALAFGDLPDVQTPTDAALAFRAAPRPARSSM